MSDDAVRGIILTGVWGAGKTTLLTALMETLAARRVHNVMAVPQSPITSPDEAIDDPALQAAVVLEVITSIVDQVETMAWRTAAVEVGGHLRPEQRRFTVVLEGFLFDALQSYPALTREMTMPLERRLADLGFEVLHLHVSEERIAQRCVESTVRHRGETWRRWMESQSPGGDGVAEVTRRQRDLERMLGDSPLRVRAIDAVTHQPAAVAREAIAGWGQPEVERGGL